MRYIHGSVIEYHGNLHSSNVLVDNRWACKITDFGLRKLRTEHELRSEREQPCPFSKLRSEREQPCQFSKLQSAVWEHTCPFSKLVFSL